MQTIHKIRLIHLCLTAFDKTIKTRFNMHSYAASAASPFGLNPDEVKNECGTSTCFAGRASLSPAPEMTQVIKTAHTWRDVAQSITGGDGDLYIWLFSDFWPDDLDFCVQRAWCLLFQGLPISFKGMASNDICNPHYHARLKKELHLPNESELRDMLAELEKQNETK